MTALVSYSTGTVSVAAAGTTVTGVGTIWSGTNVRPGDVLQIGNFQTVISDVTDVTHLVIPPWGGGAQAAVAYKIWQVSPQRFAGAQAMQSVNDLVAALNTSGFFVFVGTTETVPDPSLGDDGQYAFQPTTGKTWAKVSGVWTFLGVYKAFQLLGAWSGATAYAAGDVVTLSGSSYVCVLAHTNHTPPNTTYWQLLSSVGATGPAAWTPPAAWTTATVYSAGPPAAVVTQGGETYVCVTSHTSGTFATDLAAAKWIKVAAKGVDAPTYGGASTTSLAIGTGSKAFTTQSGLAYTNGARVRATATAGVTGWLEGVVTYSGATLTITSDKISGSGTGTAWNFNVTGEPGAGDLSSANNLSDVSNPVTAARNLGLDPYQRANSCLDRIHVSKVYLAARRGISVFADGYGASDGVNAGSSSNYTVDTSGKRVLPSSSFSRLSGGTPTAPLGGTAANINDNNTGTSITYTGTNLAAAAINSRILGKIDYGSNQTITKIEAVGLSQSLGSNSGTGLYYSTDGTTWTQLGSNLPGTTTSPVTSSVTGSVTARYIAIILPQTDFTTANVTLQDLNGYVSAPNNMTVVTTAQTADASVSNGRVLIEYDNNATPTLNTDLTVEVTCNGGTNWAAATLSLVSSNGQGGRSIAETADTVCTSGTSFAARIKTLNNKSVPVHGVSVTVH